MPAGGTLTGAEGNRLIIVPIGVNNTERLGSIKLNLIIV